jgi:hypothetical protein
VRLATSVPDLTQSQEKSGRNIYCNSNRPKIAALPWDFR